MAFRAPRHEGEECDPSDQSSKQASHAPATVPICRYLRLEGLRPGAPDLTLGCVTEGGSLAGGRGEADAAVPHGMDEGQRFNGHAGDDNHGTFDA
jgi:hypothetical protein